MPRVEARGASVEESMAEDIIGFIGAGNMATALVRGLIESGAEGAEKLCASDIHDERLKELSARFGLRVHPSNQALAQECTVIVLAVKPQNIRAVLEDIREEVRDDHLLISIAAGIPLKMISDAIGRDVAAVRVMPNTPALIQRGISALASGGKATAGDLGKARKIFDAVGGTVIVSEEMMDAVTALSGSGPGYVFKLMECFVSAGVKVGFDQGTALQLVIQTFLGAAHLAAESEKGLSDLREMVTSPGGTTAAGLTVMDERGLAAILEEVVEAACKRSIELGKNRDPN
jgi:pyrroline-5-carboxylate reductase